MISNSHSVGDLVHLKSGGPRMTIMAIAEATCTTSWFVGDVMRRRDFPEAALVRLEPAELTDEQLQAIAQSILTKAGNREP